MNEIMGPRMTPARADLLLGLGCLAMESGETDAARSHFEAAGRYWQSHAPRSRWAVEAADARLKLYRGGSPHDRCRI
jgi:hypothetical protein